jgi:hypothetical protein
MPPRGLAVDPMGVEDADGLVGGAELGPDHDDPRPVSLIHCLLQRSVVMGNVPEEVTVFDPCICHGSLLLPYLSLDLLQARFAPGARVAWILSRIRFSP